MLVAQLGCPPGPVAAGLASLSLADARPVPVLIGQPKLASLPCGMEPRSIDPSESALVRACPPGAQGDPSVVSVGRVYFVREDVMSGADGLNGRQGWQQGETIAVLSDDGSFTIVLQLLVMMKSLHRRRFQILTDANYEPGEEWLEFWRDPNDLVFVGTPTDYDKTPSTVDHGRRFSTSSSRRSSVKRRRGTAPPQRMCCGTTPASRCSPTARTSRSTRSGPRGNGTPRHTVAALTGVNTTGREALRWTSAKPGAAAVSLCASTPPSPCGDAYRPDNAQVPGAQRHRQAAGSKCPAFQ